MQQIINEWRIAGLFNGPAFHLSFAAKFKVFNESVEWTEKSVGGELWQKNSSKVDKKRTGY